MAKREEELLAEAKSEAEFFDRAYIDADDRHRSQGYLVPEKLVDPVLRPWGDYEYAYSLMGKIENKKLLDYGAGDGWNAISFAREKAQVWAIDISNSGIELVKKKAKANGVSDFIVAEVRDCYNTGFPDDMFEIIFGGGVLHHLDVEAAARELKRILNPQGVAIFYEPIRDTKIMDIIKAMVLFLIRRKASEETENESPMTSERIDLLKQYFGLVKHRHFNVLTSVTALFHSESLKKVLSRVDHFLMKIVPGYTKLAKAVVIELRNPIK
jgi:2-polyprenyl-3-methyl-5-hydroxy-6-metoxy-1,4-benzoquinol methylase